MPVTLFAIVITMTAALASDGNFLTACRYSLLVGIAPQLGYAFGLFVLSTLVAARSSRRASVAMLYKRRSIDINAARSIRPAEIATSGAVFAIMSLP